MFKRNKNRSKRQIVFDYHSLNPFADLKKNDEKNNLSGKTNFKMNDENEWRIEYELIYRSYQLDR